MNMKLAFLDKLRKAGKVVMPCAALLCSGYAIANSNPGQPKTPDLKQQLVGTWMLVSMENDTKVQILGDHPSGMIVFDSAGNFASQVMRSDLPKFASSDRTKATPEESQTVIRGAMALFGTYAAVGPNIIHLHIISSLFPNWNGVNQDRSFVIDGDSLELTNLTNSFGQSSVHAFWKRVSTPK
jgi:Lipocalin-like domain